MYFLYCTVLTHRSVLICCELPVTCTLWSSKSSFLICCNTRHKSWSVGEKMCNNLSACCAHEGEMGTKESEQVLTWKKWTMVLQPVSTETWTYGSCWLDHQCTMQTTELWPPSVFCDIIERQHPQGSNLPETVGLALEVRQHNDKAVVKC